MKIFLKLYNEIVEKEQSNKEANAGVSFLARAQYICTLISMDGMLDGRLYSDSYFETVTHQDLRSIKRCKRYFQSLGLIKTESSRKGTKYTLFKDKIDSYYSKPGENDSFFSNQTANDKVAVKDSKEDITSTMSKEEIQQALDEIHEYRNNGKPLPYIPTLSDEVNKWYLASGVELLNQYRNGMEAWERQLKSQLNVAQSR